MDAQEHTADGRPVAELGPVPETPVAGKKGTAEGLRRLLDWVAEDQTLAANVMRMREEDRANAVDMWAADRKRTHLVD